MVPPGILLAALAIGLTVYGGSIAAKKIDHGIKKAAHAIVHIVKGKK